MTRKRPTRTNPPKLPPVRRWRVDPRGTVVPGDEANGPRGRWERWAHLGALELMTVPITEGSLRVFVSYTADGAGHKQLLGLVVKSGPLWRPVGEGQRVRPDPEATVRLAAEALARRTVPDHPAPGAGPDGRPPRPSGWQQAWQE
jgi:hypothetical protein